MISKTIREAVFLAKRVVSIWMKNHLDSAPETS